jgi:integrase
VAAILKDHRARLLKSRAPGPDEGWVFPSKRGTLRAPSGLWYAWQDCLQAAGITKRFTVHGLGRTFTDLARRAGVDAITTRSLTGHVTERMHEHYSTVDLSEKRAAVGADLRVLDGKGRDGGRDAAPTEKRPVAIAAATGASVLVKPGAGDGT